MARSAGSRVTCDVGLTHRGPDAVVLSGAALVAWVCVCVCVLLCKACALKLMFASAPTSGYRGLGAGTLCASISPQSIERKYPPPLALQGVCVQVQLPKHDREEKRREREE